ncbi:MAG: phenylacetate--CoA ligase family protein [Massilia sp.]|nr:phenylacetate--CoA ligase family protein [Massilia sp.]
MIFITNLTELQARLLHATLRSAIARLPYYAHIARDFPVAATVDALLREFPIIDRDTLLVHSTELYPHGGEKMPWLALGSTSGTTGTPLMVFRSLQSVLMEQAFIKRHWSWAGYRAWNTSASRRSRRSARPDGKCGWCQWRGSGPPTSSG